MKITVLRGGPSAEREVSLVSGGAVAGGLRAMGHEVFESDIAPDDLAGLDHPADLIFPVLHGQFGESGELQEILEARGLPFVGSGSAASRLGMNKIDTKRAWETRGLPTPPWVVLPRGTPDEAFDPKGLEAIDVPCVVKAPASGSSIDVFICHDAPTATDAARRVIDGHGQALVEQFIPGTELTVGILEERALDPIRIVSRRAFFDYQAKYQDNGTEHHFDTRLPAEVVERVKSMALAAHQAVGCRDLSRVDVIVDAELRPWLLEINTLPGFTPKSLLPEAAAHAGIAFGPLVDRLARCAAGRAVAARA